MKRTQDSVKKMGLVKRYCWELTAVILCTAIAAFLRIYRLADLPPGLHGDEAITGLEALRILHDGWIGPYVGSALGQVTGTLYATALVFKLFDPSIFTVRLSMAVMGIATIPAAYFLFLHSFGRWVALFGMIFITFSYWHLHFSRVSFPIISVPLMISLAAMAILWAMRSALIWPWFFAGLVLGAGTYTHDTYLMFLGTIAIFLSINLALHHLQWRQLLLKYILLVCGLLLTALPLIQFAVSSTDIYLSHARQVSLLKDPLLMNASTTAERVDFIARQSWDAITLLFRHPDIDGIDGTGGRGALDPVLAILAYLGLGIALTKWRRPQYLLAVLTVLAGFAATVFASSHGGDMRRSLIAVPFVYSLAGIAAIEIITILMRFINKWAYLVGLTTIIAVITWNVWYYFYDFGQKDSTRWVFADDMVSSLKAAHSLEDPGIIYFYSGRWSYNYEVRQFLYPNTSGLDRSKEFGTFSLTKEHSVHVIYILLPPYVGELETLKHMYPGGKTLLEHDDRGNIRFAVYRV